MVAPLAIAALITTAGAAAYSEIAQADSTGENSIVRAVASTVVQAVPLPGGVNIFRNEASGLPTEAQVTAWMRKVGRPESLRNSIRIVRRVRTSPYVNSTATEMNLQGFAEAAGRGTGTGLKGGCCLAVLCSVETGAGNPFGNTGRNASLYNNNPGNTKLYTEGGRTLNPTPPVYFLVDRHPSLDFYESHESLETGIASWKTRTFGNARYNARGPNGEPGAMDALNDGDLEAFCAALGRGRYAASYRTLMYRRANGWNVSRYMNGRAIVLMRQGRWSTLAGRPSLPTGQMRIERP